MTEKNLKFFNSEKWLKIFRIFFNSKKWLKNFRKILRHFSLLKILHTHEEGAEQKVLKTFWSLFSAFFFDFFFAPLKTFLSLFSACFFLHLGVCSTGSQKVPKHFWSLFSAFFFDFFLYIAILNGCQKSVTNLKMSKRVQNLW